jgi:hypothetical protein
VHDDPCALRLPDDLGRDPPLCLARLRPPRRRRRRAREEPAHHFPDLAELARASDEGKVAERALHVGLASRRRSRCVADAMRSSGFFSRSDMQIRSSFSGSVGWIVRGGLTAWCRCFSR